MRIALPLAGLLYAFDTVSAQGQAAVSQEEEPGVSVVRKFVIYYRLNAIDVDENYLDNGWQIAYIRKYMSLSPKIDSITIHAWASPEGVYEHNAWLARKRAEAARRFIVSCIPDDSDMTGDRIRLSPVSENWDGLRAEIEANYTLQNKDRVMRILDADVPDDTKKWRIQHLDNGYTWHYIIVNHMPKLRVATWICVWGEPAIARVEPLQDRLKSPGSLDIVYKEQTASSTGGGAGAGGCTTCVVDRQMIFAGRTNLLVPGMNIGWEVPIGRHFSIGSDYYYPWLLHKKSNKYCHEMLGWFIDAKYWFPGKKYEWSRDDKLKGHAVGIYSGCGYYDYQWKTTACYQGEYIDAGVDYTYALPIGKKSKWMRLEFNIGVGVLWTQARHYTPTDDWQTLIKEPGIKQKYYTFFGPTRAGVRFVMPIIVNRKGCVSDTRKCIR